MPDMPEMFSYSPTLVALSVIVAIQASYVGIDLALLISSSFATRRRLLIAGSALTLAVGIWSMHFIGMLALTTPVPINAYSALPTLLSFLLCVLVVGIAVYLASLRSQRLLMLAAGVMGLGITTMHYVGMMAVHAVAHMHHDPLYVAASVLIAVAASGLALWLAFAAERRPPLFFSAVLLGCAVSGMHYTAMAGTTLLAMPAADMPERSAISGDLLAIIVSVVACSISAVFMLFLIPAERQATQSETKWQPADEPVVMPDHTPSARTDAEIAPLADETSKRAQHVTTVAAPMAEEAPPELLPIEKNGNRFHIAASEIASVHANAHYTYIFNGRDDLFCPLSITEIALRLPADRFFRTHRSYIVNLACVLRIRKSGDSSVAELDTPVRRTVPISRTRVATLRQELSRGISES